MGCLAESSWFVICARHVSAAQTAGCGAQPMTRMSIGLYTVPTDAMQPVCRFHVHCLAGRHDPEARTDGYVMLHHVSFGVADLQRSATFYDAVLGALGLSRTWTRDTAVGYGHPGGGDQFAIKQVAELAQAPGAGFHQAFTAPDRNSVAAFHHAALLHGGRDNGTPGLRLDYGSYYFAAFAIDPDGYRIEAVHDEEE
jgi:catechol 2,3-dioxygenase-like lactoylglutathione lyase family enzyme